MADDTRGGSNDAALPLIGADERSINSANVKVQRVVSEGGTAFATGQVTPTTTAATLLAARETRKSVMFYNNGQATVFIGPATVTTGNGFPLLPGMAATFNTTALLQCIIATGTATSYVAYAESYDS